MQKFRCILIWHFPSVLLVFTWPLMGKLNFHGYLLSRFLSYRVLAKLAKFDARERCFTATVTQQLRHNSTTAINIKPVCRSCKSGLIKRRHSLGYVFNCGPCASLTDAVVSLLPSRQPTVHANRTSTFPSLGVPSPPLPCHSVSFSPFPLPYPSSLIQMRCGQRCKLRQRAQVEPGRQTRFGAF